MVYKFECLKCGNIEEKTIPINEYDQQKGCQYCSKCKNKMTRVLEFTGSIGAIGGYDTIGGAAKWQS